ncbi:DinB/UmuC family translesion DNA polymerase [Streptomyces sp. NPDC002671]
MTGAHQRRGQNGRTHDNGLSYRLQRATCHFAGASGDQGRLRDTSEIAQALTLTITYADRTQTARTRTLPEPTVYTPTLAAHARELLAGLGLQRARVRALAVRAERLRPAEHAARQLTLDDHDDRKLRRELRRIQLRPHLTDGCLTATGLAIDPPTPP